MGQHYTPLGTTDFAAIVERIRKSGADIVLSSLVGSDEVAFQRQSAQTGLHSTARTLSLVMDESTYEHIGSTSDGGIWTALSYFESASDAGNRELLSRYRERYGRWAPPVTTLSETVYEAILQYARIVDSRINDPAHEHARLLRRHRHTKDPGVIGDRDLTSQRLHLARTHLGSLEIFDRID